MFKLLNSFLELLEIKRKSKFWVLMLFMVLYACIEMATVAILSSYVTLLIDFDAFIASSYFNKAVLYFDFITIEKLDLVFYLSGLALFIIIIKNITKLALVYSVSTYSSNISFDVGKYLTLGFINSPYEWYMKQKISDLALVIQWRSQVGLMVSSILNIMSDIILTVIMLLTVLYFSSNIAILVVSLIGVFGFFIFRVIKKHIDINSTILKDSLLEIHREISRAMYGFKEVKIYEMENEAVEGYSKPASNYAKANVMKDLYIPFPALMLETVGVAVLVSFVIFAMTYQSQSGAYITSSLAVVVLIMWRTLPAVGRIVNNFAKFRKVLPVVQTIEEFVQQIKSNAASSSVVLNKKNKVRVDNDFKIKDLTFNYSGGKENALSKINLSFHKGMSIGVVGPSGSGKSTLADILVGLLKATDGSLVIGNEQFSLKKLLIKLDKLSYVSQSPFFFDGTIAENISFSTDREAINFNSLEKSCSMAALDEVIENLPEGYETLIGERGIRLSGGQLQRIAIARALYRNPDIILFDESTSSLDLKSEKAIQKTINQLAGNITLIIIAHRLETVEKCDHILWINNGFIVDQGSADIILPRYRKSLQQN